MCPTVAIIGGGITGAVAAKLALDAGWCVEIIEQSGRVLEGVNAGLFYSHKPIPGITGFDFKIFYFSEMKANLDLQARAYAGKAGKPDGVETSFSQKVYRPDKGWWVDIDQLRHNIRMAKVVEGEATCVYGNDLGEVMVDVKQQAGVGTMTFTDKVIVTIPAPALFAGMLDYYDIATTGVSVDGLMSDPVIVVSTPGRHALDEPFMEVVYNTHSNLGIYEQLYYRSSELVLPNDCSAAPVKLFEFALGYLHDKGLAILRIQEQLGGRQLYPGKIVSGSIPEGNIDALACKNVHLVGRYARWQAKWMLHDSYSLLAEIFDRS